MIKIWKVEYFDCKEGRDLWVKIEAISADRARVEFEEIAGTTRIIKEIKVD